jgi:cbb3-type cytochrome oxidase subunit 1
VADASARARLRPAVSDDVVTLHIVVSTFFLGVGGLLYAASIAAVVFPSVFSGPLSYGRLRPAAMTAVMIGWLLISFLGAAYYVLPRLTGSELWQPRLAGLAMWGFAAIAAVGTIGPFIGLSDGIEPLDLPWWLDTLLLLVSLVPLAVGVQTVRYRFERLTYVSLWFVLTGLATLPILFTISAVGYDHAIGQTLQGLHFTSGFTVLWVTGMGVGLAYYTVAKAADQPLANRQLARAGFWSLAFAATWSGPLQLVYGPTPDWLDALAAVLTLALPVAAAANTVALATTAAPAWERVGSKPSIRATMAGMGVGVAVGLATAVAGFRSAAALVGFTSYWEGVTMAALFGVGGLLVSGWTFQALPAAAGRELASPERALQSIRLTVWGVGGAALLMVIGGIVTGLSWTGGAFTSTPAIGENWEAVSGLGSLMIGLSLIGIAVMLLGQLAFILSVLGTISRGSAAQDEVLMTKGGA